MDGTEEIEMTLIRLFSVNLTSKLNNWNSDRTDNPLKLLFCCCFSMGYSTVTLRLLPLLRSALPQPVLLFLSAEESLLGSALPQPVLLLLSAEESDGGGTRDRKKENIPRTCLGL